MSTVFIAGIGGYKSTLDTKNPVTGEHEIEEKSGTTYGFGCFVAPVVRANLAEGISAKFAVGLYAGCEATLFGVEFGGGYQIPKGPNVDVYGRWMYGNVFQIMAGVSYGL